MIDILVLCTLISSGALLFIEGIKFIRKMRANSFKSSCCNVDIEPPKDDKKESPASSSSSSSSEEEQKKKKKNKK